MQGEQVGHAFLREFLPRGSFPTKLVVLLFELRIFMARHKQKLTFSSTYAVDRCDS